MDTNKETPIDTNIKHVVKHRKSGRVVREFKSARLAHRHAWAMNDLCGSQTAFYATRITK
jgi:hypothetical protein